MDYKKKYEEALEKGREFYNRLGNKQLKEEVELIFPELVVSEDERIRKEIINMSNTLGRKDWIAWLEKQGEQKPAEWSEKDSLMLDSIISIVEEWESNQSEKEEEYYGESSKSEWLKYLKDRVQPNQEWSEEDESCINQLIVFCENCMVQDSNAKKCAEWLKSLRPQSQWKPSNEQMDAF